MANHLKLMELPTPECYELIGKLVHLVMNDETSFEIAYELVEVGERIGKLNDVIINPEKNGHNGNNNTEWNNKN